MRLVGNRNWPLTLGLIKGATLDTIKWISPDIGPVSRTIHWILLQVGWEDLEVAVQSRELP